MSDPFDTELDELAKSVVTRARADGAKLPDMTDALKALTALYVARKKNKAGAEQDDEPTMDDFAAEMNGGTNGRTAIPDRRRTS